MRLRTRAWLAALVVALVAVVLAVGTLVSWTVSETHFDRPTAEFDAFAQRVDELLGVGEVQQERWVEAPLFVDPNSWLGLTVDQEHLPGLLDTVCSWEHTEAVSWSISVSAEAGGETSLHSHTDSSGRALSEDTCPSFGFDAVPLVDELDAVAPGLAVQPAIWDNGRFALVSIADGSEGYLHLLPLVEHSDELLAAASLGADREVEINSTTLGATILPGEQDAYLVLLSELAREHEATDFWADDGGSMIDGDARVQITAPAAQQAAIKSKVGASGLHIAGFPVEFHER